MSNRKSPSPKGHQSPPRITIVDIFRNNNGKELIDRAIAFVGEKRFITYIQSVGIAQLNLLY